MSSEAEQYGRELEQQRRGFEEITAEIQAFQDLISVNEQNIAEFQRQLDEKQEKIADRSDCISQRILQTGVAEKYYRTI